MLGHCNERGLGFYKGGDAREEGRVGVSAA